MAGQKEFWQHLRVADAFASLPQYRGDGMRIPGLIGQKGLKKYSPHDTKMGKDIHKISHDVIGWGRIGYWGQVWSLGVLWSLVAHKHSDTIRSNRALATQIFPDPVRSIATHELMDIALPGHKLHGTLLINPKETFQFLLGKGTFHKDRVLPSSAISKFVRDAFAEFVFKALQNDPDITPSEEATSDTLIATLDKDHETLKECFLACAKHLGLTSQFIRRDKEAVPQQIGESYIDPRIWEYVSSDRVDGVPGASSRGAQIVKDLSDHLTPMSEDAAAKAAVILGNPHDGKKSVIGDFLKGRYKPAQPLVFSCSRGHDVHDLPILCLSAASCDIYELFAHVIVFLERICGTEQASQEQAVQARLQTFDHPASPPSIDALSRRLEELLGGPKMKPIFVILVDVETRSDELRSLIRRNDTTRLLNALCRKQHGNLRLILTASEHPNLLGIEPLVKQMDPPTGSQLSWYLTQGQNEVFNSENVQAQLGRKFHEFCPGKVLLSLSVLFDHPEYAPTAFVNLMRDAIQEENKNQSGLLHVCKALVNVWDKEGLLPWVALIMASEDGMMEQTLLECMTDWQKHDEKLRALETVAALQQLNELSLKGRGFFLESLDSAPHRKEEARFDEYDETKPVKLLTFEASCAEALRTALKKFQDGAGGDVLGMANRYVAIQARRRARYRTIGQVRMCRSGQNIAERTVQSLVALLLSLNKIEDPTPLPKTFDLRKWSDHVFTADPAKFDPIIALNYAVEVMLFSEADQGYRMSMSLDTDLLRLSVYALVFAPLGVRRTWEKAALRHGALPDFMRTNLPAHMACFSLEVQAKLLTSLGMAAHFSCHYPILVWAEWQIGLLIEEYGSKSALVLARGRLAAARLDSETRAGRPFSAAKYLLQPQRKAKKKTRKAIKSGFYKSPNLKGLTEYWKKYLELFESQLSKLGAKHQPDIAIDRLAVRYQRLLSIAGCSNTLQLDYTAPHRRLGRTGRLALEMELAGYPFFTSKLPKSASAFRSITNSLLHANVARLNAFDGAERSLVSADLALALLLREENEAAVRAVREARNLVLRGTAGNAVKLEVLYSEVGIILSAIEAGADPIQLKGLTNSLEYLEQISRELFPGVSPVAIMIDALHARAAMMRKDRMAARAFLKKAEDGAKKLGAKGLSTFLSPLVERNEV